MNIAEILRGLADKIEGGSEVPHQDQSAQLHPAQAQHDENPEVNTDSMVSPLQQKLELLKRAVGVDNMYDIRDGEDELDQILKIAGVPTATVFDAGDDEPLDS